MDTLTLRLLFACEANLRTLNAITDTTRSYFRGERTAEQALERILDLSTLTDQSEQVIADANVERILAMSDEEILAETRRNGEDPDEIARRMRELFEQTVARMKREGR